MSVSDLETTLIAERLRKEAFEQNDFWGSLIAQAVLTNTSINNPAPSQCWIANHLKAPPPSQS